MKENISFLSKSYNSTFLPNNANKIYDIEFSIFNIFKMSLYYTVGILIMEAQMQDLYEYRTIECLVFGNAFVIWGHSITRQFSSFFKSSSECRLHFYGI